jgi:hypothetical protein
VLNVADAVFDKIIEWIAGLLADAVTKVAEALVTPLLLPREFGLGAPSDQRCGFAGQTTAVAAGGPLVGSDVRPAARPPIDSSHVVRSSWPVRDSRLGNALPGRHIAQPITVGQFADRYPSANDAFFRRITNSGRIAIFEGESALDFGFIRSLLAPSRCN